MKTFSAILGFVLLCVSMLLFLMAFILSSRPGAPIGFIAGLGTVAFVTGFAMARASSRKDCPACGERIKNTAQICRYCGHKIT
jgi:hypothetical protein